MHSGARLQAGAQWRQACSQCNIEVTRWDAGIAGYNDSSRGTAPRVCQLNLAFTGPPRYCKSVLTFALAVGFVILKHMSNASIMAIAHRGASAYAPENTVAAFDEAIRLGCPAVELDVRLTSDGVPVVLHDETVDRTTNGSGRVSDLSRIDLLRLDAGSWKHPRFAGTRIPTLDEALHAIAGLALPVLELKVPLESSVLREILELHDALADAVVLSFEPAIVAAVRRDLPSLRVGLLAETWHSSLPRRALDLGATLVVLDVGAVAQPVADAVHKAGLRLWCYTVNDAGAAAACGAMGVSGIITDKPDLIRSRKRHARSM